MSHDLSPLGFRKTPFTRKLTVRERFPLDPQAQVAAALTEAVHERMSAALIAPAGTGKTVALRMLVAALPETRFQVHYVKVTGLSKRDLCKEIAVACGLSVLGVTGGIGGSRVIRGAVIGVKENVYFQAAEAIGSTKWRTLIRHVLPNIGAPIIIIFTINVGAVIISEAALSFLGFGLPISVPSWGGMLSREGREFMEVAPRLALWPGLCLTIVVYCLNMFGDAVRDLLDPRLRGGARRLGADAARSV